jgi:phage terminase large subunit-like protein
VFKERLDYWRDVRDGKISDPKTLGILYEFPDSMIQSKAYLQPENFYITNPNIGFPSVRSGLPITCERTRRKLTARCSSFWQSISTSKSALTCALTAGQASISGNSRRSGQF